MGIVADDTPGPGQDPGGPVASSPGAFLTDFGLATSVADGPAPGLGRGLRLTRTGQALGTPAYMSPEQARGEITALTQATDIWSLGCVLHEMLAGGPPWRGETPAAVMGMVLLEAPPPLRRFRPEVPEALGAIVRIALAKSPHARHADVRALREDLDRVLRGESPRTRSPGSRRRLAIGGLLVIAAVAWGALAIFPGSGTRTADWEAGEDGAGLRPVPESLSAPQRAARARALRASDPRAAARLLDEALAAEPSRHEWRLERGLLLWGLGDGAAAREEWSRVPDGAPQRTAARLYLGLEPFTQLRSAEGRSHLEALAAAGGRESRIARGTLAAVAKEWNRAREELRDVAGWEASLVRAYVASFDPAADKAAGLREYTAALAEGPPLVWAYVNRGSLRTQLGDFAGGVGDFEAALKLRPGHADAWFNRGFARRRLGDLRGALEDYAEALRLVPDDPEILNNRAVARLELGDLDRAAEDCGAALRFRPDYALARVNLGKVRARQQRWREAAAEFSEAIRLGHPDVQGLRVLVAECERQAEAAGGR